MDGCWCLVLGNKRHNAAMFNTLDVQKLDADPGIFDGVAHNRPTADFAEGGQLEPHVHERANGEGIIEFKEGSVTAKHHEVSTGSWSRAIGPYVSVEADLRAWELPPIGRCVGHCVIRPAGVIRDTDGYPRANLVT